MSKSEHLYIIKTILSNMRHKQKTLNSWINPEKAFLQNKIIRQLKEFEFYERDDSKE